MAGPAGAGVAAVLLADEREPSHHPTSTNLGDFGMFA